MRYTLSASSFVSLMWNIEGQVEVFRHLFGFDVFGRVPDLGLLLCQ